MHLIDAQVNGTLLGVRVPFEKALRYDCEELNLRGFRRATEIAILCQAFFALDSMPLQAKMRLGLRTSLS